MKKYQLGALTVSDKGLQDTKEEIIVELIDRLQKYAAQADAVAHDTTLTPEERCRAVKTISESFCGLSEFLNLTMGIDVRGEDGLLYTQSLFNRMHYHVLTLNIETKMNKNTAPDTAMSESGT